MTDVDERVARELWQEYRRRYVHRYQMAHDKPRHGGWFGNSYWRDQWEATTEDQHHLAACGQGWGEVVDYDVEGGCAEGTCDAWTVFDVVVRCPHGLSDNIRYSSSDMHDTLVYLLEDTVDERKAAE